MQPSSFYLWMTSGGLHCGLPLDSVLEIFRPLPVQALGSAPDFVLGLARVRGEAVPVVHLGRLLGLAGRSEPGRFVRLSVGERRVVLAVDGVLGLRELPGDAAGSLPPQLDRGLASVESLGALDRSLFLVLGAAKLLPPDLDAA
ncbi:MAG TPA: chemotaxis protein CheW [bacterium]|nr:chemotaxis protein CheW [bacterium]